MSVFRKNKVTDKASEKPLKTTKTKKEGLTTRRKGLKRKKGIKSAKGPGRPKKTGMLATEEANGQTNGLDSGQRAGEDEEEEVEEEVNEYEQSSDGESVENKRKANQTSV